MSEVVGERVVHQPTPYSCVACVVAMITGDDLEKIFDEFGHDGNERHFRFLECAAYLNRRGYHLGMMMKGPGCLSIDLQQPALAIVASSDGKGNHAVYWDGEVIRDPDPANAGKPRDHYRVVEWWVITKYKR
jgi:hypothetical protein